MREAITDDRAGRTEAGTGTALRVIAYHRDPSGDLIDVRTATTELHNVLRPNVAVSWFVSFAALALYRHPQWLRDGDGSLLRAFAHEVRRRLFPFVPVLAARTRHDLDWDEHHLPAGGHVVLDVHGTNHDPRYWPNPDTFDPDRFVGYHAETYTLIPRAVATAPRDTGVPARTSPSSCSPVPCTP
jgi:fatty-acid peroxygenase